VKARGRGLGRDETRVAVIVSRVKLGACEISELQEDKWYEGQRQEALSEDCWDRRGCLGDAGGRCGNASGAPAMWGIVTGHSLGASADIAEWTSRQVVQDSIMVTCDTLKVHSV
jgi:hypothetical protein